MSSLPRPASAEPRADVGFRRGANVGPLSIASDGRTMDVLGPGQGLPLSLAPCGTHRLGAKAPVPALNDDLGR